MRRPTRHARHNGTAERAAPHSLSISALRKEFRAKGGRRVVGLGGVDAELAAGEMLVLLGPSGCGKSTTLRCVAGLESPDTGRICFGDTPVFDASTGLDVPSERRDIGMVYQNFALWPHMTVRQIVEFPLRTRKIPHEERVQRVATSLGLVDCGELADRYPSQLSGGQQQRVALARALVAEPAILLFDEPLSNLDAGLRGDLRGEIRRLHRVTGFTGIYVTHDQVEALAVADWIAVMRSGLIVQTGKPRDIYESPANEWVAGFMGFTNRLTATNPGAGTGRTLSPEGRVFRFRPEAIEIEPQAREGPGGLCFHGVVSDVAFIGSGLEYHVVVGDSRLEAIATPEAVAGIERSLEPGAEFDFAVADKDLVSFDPVPSDAEGNSLTTSAPAESLMVASPE